MLESSESMFKGLAKPKEFKPWRKPCHGEAYARTSWNRNTGWWLTRCICGHRKMGRA